MGRCFCALQPQLLSAEVGSSVVLGFGHALYNVALRSKLSEEWRKGEGDRRGRRGVMEG